jgi:hypothetical protein
VKALGWLLCQDRVLASLEVREGLLSTAKGALSARPLDRAVLLLNTTAVHTFFMPHSVDVIWLDREMQVVAAKSHVAPFRILVPRRGARHVLEAPSGSIERWGLAIGQKLEMKL